MVVSAKIPPPVPPNGNLDRAMFVWVPQIGGASDPLSTDARMQTLLDFCAANGVNLLFLDIYRYIGGANWDVTNGHATVMAKFIHWAHASGIRVYALAGDTGWGQNHQWVAGNIIRNLAQFNALAQTGPITNEAGAFDGLIFDVEYWTGTYTEADPAGFCDLMNSARRILDIPVGCAATQWLADPASAALTFTYRGVSQIEGLHLLDQSDFVAVMCYSNNAGGTDGATQIAMMQAWYNHALVSRNGLLCVSDVQGGLGSQSYAGETKAVMEQNHAAISVAYATNLAFRGQAVQDYASYVSMT